jgi:hypothetical protein
MRTFGNTQSGLLLGNCNILAERKISFINEIKQREITPRLKDWVQKIFHSLPVNFVKGPCKSWLQFHSFCMDESE